MEPESKTLTCACPWAAIKFLWVSPYDIIMHMKRVYIQEWFWLYRLTKYIMNFASM